MYTHTYICPYSSNYALICVCMYIRRAQPRWCHVFYIYTFTHIHTPTHPHSHTHTRSSTHSLICVCLHIRRANHIDIMCGMYIHTCKHTYIRPHACVCTYAKLTHIGVIYYVYIKEHIHTLTYTHINIPVCVCMT